MSSALLLIGGGLVLVLLRFLYNILSDPARTIPGPALARCTRAWYFFAVSRGDFEETNIRLHQKYGMVMSSSSGPLTLINR